VKSNVIVSSLRRLTRFAWLAARREKTAANDQVRQLSIKTPSLDAPIGSLSGGNQQKCVLGRALLTEPTVLLLDEPTRGIDVGAKAEISRIMSALSRSGMGVLFVSSELAEMLAMSDRIIVMARGRVTAEFTAGNVTEQDLVTASASDRALGVAS
jgi:erythritol transport system ATP-binding protein